MQPPRPPATQQTQPVRQPVRTAAPAPPTPPAAPATACALCSTRDHNALLLHKVRSCTHEQVHVRELSSCSCFTRARLPNTVQPNGGACTGTVASSSSNATCSPACLNGGTCTSNSTSGTSYCLCPSTYQGPTCSLPAQGRTYQEQFSALLPASMPQHTEHFA